MPKSELDTLRNSLDTAHRVYNDIYEHQILIGLENEAKWTGSFHKEKNQKNGTFFYKTKATYRVTERRNILLITAKMNNLSPYW